MKKRKKINFEEIKLLPEEQAIEDSDDWVPAPPERVAEVKREFDALQAAAKLERVTIRINSSDLHLLQKIADEKGIEYQTLLGSIVHQFVTGNLVEKSAAEHAMNVLSRETAKFYATAESKKKAKGK